MPKTTVPMLCALFALPALAERPVAAGGAAPAAAIAGSGELRIQLAWRATGSSGGPAVKQRLQAPPQLAPDGAGFTVPAGKRLVIDAYTIDGGLCTGCDLVNVLLSGTGPSGGSAGYTAIDLPFHAAAAAQAESGRRVGGAGAMEAGFDAGAEVQLDLATRLPAGRPGAIAVTVTLFAHLVESAGAPIAQR